MPVIFLSPSTQEWNKYVNGGSEEQYMNLIADAMEPYLTASGIQFVRNDPARNVTGAIADSNAGNFDVHFAIHSNAGGGEYAGVTRGIEIYYSPYSDYSRQLATITANNLKSIYPLPEKTVTVPTTALAEVTQTRAVSVLCELGYHDNVYDADWIKNNIDAIARNLVQSLCDYFGIPFIEADPVRTGTVNAGGSNQKISVHYRPSYRKHSRRLAGHGIRSVGRLACDKVCRHGGICFRRLRLHQLTADN